MTNEMEEIERKIADALNECETEAALDALLHVFIFRMSYVCGDCRKNIAKELRKRIPDMLSRANHFAATIDDDQPTCH